MPEEHSNTAAKVPAGHTLTFDAMLTIPERKVSASDLLSDAMDIHRVVYVALLGDRSMLGGAELCSAAYLLFRAQENVERVWEAMEEAVGTHRDAALAGQDPESGVSIGGKAVRA